MTQNKMLVMIQKLYFCEASMLEYSSGVRFSGVKDWAKVTPGSAGIQDVDTHAPCWNQVKMCVQIRPLPSALRVFGAGTQYGFKENRGCRNAGIQ